MRHTFVSLLSDDGMPLENIARLVGHRGSAVTELVYQQQLRPVLEDGARAMDRIVGEEERRPDEEGDDAGAAVRGLTRSRSHSVSHSVLFRGRFLYPRSGL